MYYITISNGLLTQDHRKRMGSAVWEFMWCIDKITRIDSSGMGYVLGGKPIRLSDISMGHENTTSRNLSKLEKEGYLSITRTPYGLSIKVRKTKKRFNKNNRPDVEEMPSVDDLRKKMSEDRKGEKHYNWKGGITPENHEARNNFEYKLWRADVFERDSYKCGLCGQHGGKLEAHHIRSFADHKDLRYEVNNGVTLCKKHHKEVHNLLRITENSESLSLVDDPQEYVNLLRKMVNVNKIIQVDNTDDKTIAEPSSAKLITELIRLFEDVNPACKTMYGNTTQRKACEYLIAEYGFDEVSRVVAFLPRSNKMSYVPTINTPNQLWTKYQALKDSLERKKGELQAKGRGIA